LDQRYVEEGRFTDDLGQTNNQISDLDVSRIVRATHTGGTTLALRRLSDLPGPRGLPVLGNLHQTMKKWARQHGPVYRVKVPTGAFLVVADPDLVGKVLRERPDT